MWRLQNDMSPVSRAQPKKEESDDQPTFTDIQLDVREESSTMSGFLRG
jgi:twitching motility protein PilU